MSLLQIIAYLDPDRDLDEQRATLAQDLPDAEVLEEHVGGWKAAMLSADSLGVPMWEVDTPTAAAPAPSQQPHHLARRRKSQERYERLRPAFRQMELLGYATLGEMARHLNEEKVPLPSGKPGRWTASQVKRAQAWLSE